MDRLKMENGKRFVWTAVIFLMTAFSVMAQSEYISNSRFTEADRLDDLDGHCGVLLLSLHNDLVINITNLGKKAEIRPKGKRSDGYYEYCVVINKEDTRNPKIEVSRRGNVYKTEFVSSVKPDFMMAYRIEEVLHPIRMDDQTKPNDARLNAEEAELEFTSTIEDLKVFCSPKLNAKISSKISNADRNIRVTTVVIPVTVLKKAGEDRDLLQKEYDNLESKIQKHPDGVGEEDWKRYDALEEEIKKAEGLWQELTNVEIYGDRTNRLAIDISDMGPRSKKCYAVLPLTIEKKIFVTECSAYMNQGGEWFTQRKYKEAKASYVNALEAKDVVADMKPAIQKMIAQCDTCMRYESLAAKAVNEILRMRKDGSATQDKVAQYASAAIDFMKLVYDLNPDDFYTSRIDKLEELVAGMPLMLKFTIVEWLTFNEGGPIPGVEIWAYYGGGNLSSARFTSERSFKKALDKETMNYRQLSVSDRRGEAEVELVRKELPKGFVFVPVDNKHTKIKYVSMDEMMRQSKGTYMERRLRLKMYTKLK